MTQLSSQSCLRHQESIPHLFFDRSALGTKIWTAPEQLQKASNYNDVGIVPVNPRFIWSIFKIFPCQSRVGQVYVDKFICQSQVCQVLVDKSSCQSRVSQVTVKCKDII